MLVPNRHGSSNSYRYGFQGQEKDNEIKGEGNSYDFGARMLDPRVGRWFANDPSAHLQPSSSPYSFANNNPVILVDPDGELPIIPLLIKAGAAGGADMMMQVAMSYYFDDDVKSIGQAFEKVDYLQVARSAAEGLIPWKVPGGKLGKAGATALGDVMTNAISAGVAGKEYSKSQAVQDFTAGFLSDLAGGEIADLVKKFGGNKVRQVFTKLGLPDPCGCFTARTQIYTKNGYKNIENVQVGDLVWAYNEKTNNQELKKVINTYVKVRDHIYKIYFGENIIEATEDHPFFIGGSWLKVKELKVGDLLTLYNGKKLPISKIEFIKGKFEVFNFEVEEDHTYYVSLGNILVHNSGPCDWKPSKGRDGKFGKSSQQYRANLEGFSGVKPKVGQQAHHMLPKNSAYADFFENSNIDVNDPQLMKWMDSGNGVGSHSSKFSSEYDKLWKEFIDNSGGKKYSKESLMKKATEFEKKAQDVAEKHYKAKKT